jgi:hypothetical protein
MQGRVSADDVASGRAADGYTCNTAVVAQVGTTGGYRVQRYVDAAGHVCAYFDTTLLFPTNALAGDHATGVDVLDLTDPTHPIQTAVLSTPAMQSPHESLSLNSRRGLLAADLGTFASYPGWVDIYDVSKDCRHPALDSSLPLGILGHEGAFSPDGRTFWVSAGIGSQLTAIDVSNPLVPTVLWTQRGVDTHGLNVSDDGNTVYDADLGTDNNTAGLNILDVSQIQHRDLNPVVKVVTHMSWPDVSLPQTDLPVTIGHHRYIVEVDEFATDGTTGQFPSASDVGAHVGAVRVIDIADPSHPNVVSHIRLEVNQSANRPATFGDPGASSGTQGYAAHYCSVPSRDDPGILACSFILSGLRVFDIRDPYHPTEIAYFNAPVKTTTGNWAMSAPAFDPVHGQIWYSDANEGFFVVQVTNGVWPRGRRLDPSHYRSTEQPRR